MRLLFCHHWSTSLDLQIINHTPHLSIAFPIFVSSKCHSNCCACLTWDHSIWLTSFTNHNFNQFTNSNVKVPMIQLQACSGSLILSYFMTYIKSHSSIHKCYTNIITFDGNGYIPQPRHYIFYLALRSYGELQNGKGNFLQQKRECDISVSSTHR